MLCRNLVWMVLFKRASDVLVRAIYRPKKILQVLVNKPWAVSFPRVNSCVPGFESLVNKSTSSDQFCSTFDFFHVIGTQTSTHVLGLRTSFASSLPHACVCQNFFVPPV